jgi:ATP synthase protein I
MLMMRGYATAAIARIPFVPAAGAAIKALIGVIRVMDDPQPPQRAPGSMADTVRTIGALSTVGISFVLAIAIGAGLGWYLDKSFGTAPWLFFVFFAIGVAAGVLNVYRTAGRFLK